MMNLLYIVMGGEEAMRYYMEAYLSIRTFQKQWSPTVGRICVLTDHPSFFRRAGVEVHTVTPEQKSDWMGPHQFFFRTKIKGIEHLHSLYPDDDLLYLDSDTFLYGSLTRLTGLLAEGHGLMHLCEGRPTAISNTARRLWKGTAGHTYAGITIGERHQMWNAGVIGLPHEKVSETISCALTLCDGMLDDGADTFITEQYANSIALSEHTSLTAVSDVIGHYWSNKSVWEQLASNIFMSAYLTDATLEEELAALDVDALRRVPIHVHHSHRAEQLHGLVSRLFPDSDERCVEGASVIS